MTHCRQLTPAWWDVLAHMPLERRRKKKETVTAPVNARAGHLHRFSRAVFFSHFVTLSLYLHIPSSKCLMWILTKLYGLFNPAPIEERPPIISVGAEFRQFGNPGEKNIALSFKKTFRFSFIHVDVKQLSCYRVLQVFLCERIG